MNKTGRILKKVRRARKLTYREADRSDVIGYLFDLCAKGVDKGDYSIVRKAISICFDWNEENPDAEIDIREGDDYILIEDYVVYFNGKEF